MLNETHIRSFTDDEFFDLVTRGYFEFTPELCKAAFERLQAFLEDYNEIKEELEYWNDKTDYDDLVDENGDLQDEIDELKDDVDRLSDENDTLDEKLHDREIVLHDILQILDDEGIVDKIVGKLSPTTKIYYDRILKEDV